MHPTTLVQPTIIPCTDCCRSLLFPASTFSPQSFCNTISKFVLVTCKLDHITPLNITPLLRTLSGFPFHLVLCDPGPCDHSDLKTQSLHSSPTGFMSPTFFPAPDLCICGSLYGMFFLFLLASSSFRSQPHISSSGNLSCTGQLPYHVILQDHVTPICSIYNNLYSHIYLWDYFITFLLTLSLAR